VYRPPESSLEQPTRPLSAHIHHPIQKSAGARPRSKTFEEYEKETDDAWDDREEEFSDSLPSDLEFPRPQPPGGEGGGEVGAGAKKTNFRGKGKSKCLWRESVCRCMCEVGNVGPS